MHQYKAEISYLWTHLKRGVKPALCQIASLSHHPVTLVSTLPVSQLACEVSHDPLLLCCCFVLRESRTAGMRYSLMGFSCHVSMWKKREHKLVFSPSQHCPLVKQASPCGQNVSFGVSWRKCSSARGDEWAVSIQSTFQKAAEAVILAGCHRD